MFLRFIFVCQKNFRVAVQCVMRNVRLIDKDGKPIWTKFENGVSVAGRVEVFKNNEWGTVCNQNFGQKEATIVCKTIGYQNGIPITQNNNQTFKFNQGTDKIWLNQVSCSGYENSILECKSGSIQTCTHRQRCVV